MRILTICGFAISLVQCIQIPKTTEINQELEHISVKGYRFHSHITGKPENPALIVLHGGPGNDFHYLKSLEQLSDRYYILFYDQRMSGLSSRSSNAEPGPDQDIQDLFDLTEAFAPKRKLILIGHSYGAMIASGFISRYPDKVSEAVIIEPGILNKETSGIFIRALKAHNHWTNNLKIILPLIRSVFVKSEDGHERMDYIVNSMMGTGKGRPYQCPGVSIPKDSFVRAGYALMKKTTIPLMDNPDNFEYDLTKGLKKFPGRILLLSSSCSFIGYDYQEKYHKQFFPDHAVHLKLEDTGHNFLTTDPAMGIQRIREFLAPERLE
jgi:proline iminopeptidase